MSNNYKQYIHIEPEKGWLNDPNGLVYIDGTYHIYYQYSYDVNGKLKYWYHLSSEDLITYKDLGIFLSPTDSFDKDGVYSGSCNIENNKPIFYYTGNVKHSGNFDYIHNGRENNTIIYDGKHKKLLLSQKDYINMSNHVRDPKIYKDYLILGARDSNDNGCIILFKDNKHYKTIYANEKLGYMWECPDLFELNGTKILLFSPQGVQNKFPFFDNKYQVCYSLIKEDIKDIKKIDNFNLLDYGHDFYATQTFLDENNKRVMYAWMYVPDSDYYNDTVKYDYQNCLSIPRILDFDGKKLLQKIHPSVYKLLKNKITSLKFEKRAWYFKTQEEFNIKTDELEIKYSNKMLYIDIQKVGCGRQNRSFNIELKDIEIVFDSSSFEIFVNNGSWSFSSRYYPKTHNVEIQCSNYEAIEFDKIKIGE